MVSVCLPVISYQKYFWTDLAEISKRASCLKSNIILSNTVSNFHRFNMVVVFMTSLIEDKVLVIIEPKSIKFAQLYTFTI